VVDPIGGGGDSSQPIGGTAIKPVGWDRTGWEAFKYMLCDPQKGTILTRTPLSWVKIIAFYIIYYSCLATFWITCLFIFGLTLPYTFDGPKWKMESGLIGSQPGVGIRPRNADALIDSQMFQLESEDQNPNPSRPGGEGFTNADYAARVQRFLENYMKNPAQPSPEYPVQDYEDLEYVEATGQLLIHLEGGVVEVTNLQVRDQLLINMALTPNENFVPKFKGYKAFDPTTTLGPCGIFPYGYVGEHVQPCIYIKLNKIWGWEPRPVQCDQENYGYDYNYDCPESLRKHLNSPAAKEAGEENIWIDCYGRNAADKEALEGRITYYPASRAIPISYFPYLGERNQLDADVGYHSPLVAIQVDPRNSSPHRGQLVHMECKAYYKGVRHNRKDKIGLVQFEVQIN